MNIYFALRRSGYAGTNFFIITKIVDKPDILWYH